MKKRILALLLAVLTVCALLPQTALYVRAGGDYPDGSCGPDLFWEFNTDTGVLKITGNKGMKMNDFSVYGLSSELPPWYSYRDQIKSIVLPKELKRIGRYAFYECTALTSVTLPTQLEEIADCAFLHCPSLPKIVFPKTLKKIGYGAFYSCVKLASFDLPDSLTEIGLAAFYGCAVKKLTLPKNLTFLPGQVFANCRSLNSVTLPEGLVEIGEGAFARCDMLNDIAFPKSLKKIGAFAFDECSALKTLSFNEGLTEIGEYGFMYCTGLESVRFPNSLNSIQYFAFYGCSGLTEITLPKKLKTLGGAAFWGCSNLKRIVCRSNTPYLYLYLVYPGKERPESTGGFWPSQPISFAEDDDYKDYYNDMLGPHETVEIYGYAKGAEGAMRKESVWTVQDGEITARTGKWSQYIVNYAKAKKYKFYPVDKFEDVKDGDAFQIPVAWAVGNKVTAGMDKTHFGPDKTVTRAQAMTFFWAAQKKPAPKAEKSPFVDVKKTDWYFKSVMWAVENGVTAGTDATHFSPNKTCNRGEILAFLYASLNKPKVKIKNPYKDVSNQWYKKAALWAYANGIEKGEKGKFNASTPCTRASTVTYLYRFFTGLDLAK